MDAVIASLNYVCDALEEIESHVCFLSSKDRDAFREIIMTAVPDHGRFYSDNKDVLVRRVLGILSDETIVAGLDFSKLSSSQKKEISKLFWAERDIYETSKDAVTRMMEILGK